MPADNLSLTALMMLCVLGLSSAGVLAVAPRWASVLSFVLPMVTGLITALAWQTDETHLFLAACCAIYLGATLHFAYQQHLLLTNALTMRFEKQSLAEQLERQMAVTQHLSEEKTRFFASASHDLRQPLHAISLFGAVLEKDLNGRPEHALAQRLMESVRALSTSLDTMLDVSLLDAGVIVPDFQVTTLNSVFQQLNQMFASRAEQKGLQLRLRASQLCVKTDKNLLLRLLSNLIENAIKYTPRGGVLVVARAKGAHVWIEVCDTGIGIASEELQSIFDEFYQVNNPGRDRALGLGIGLSMVRRLSLLLSHPVSVRSQLGRGSCFRVQLLAKDPPVTQELQSADRPWMPNYKSAHGRSFNFPQRVLFLDDEADIGDAVAALLEAYGVELVVVRDEVGATDAFIQATKGKPFDALVFDYRLAIGANGLDIALRLRDRFDPQLRLLLVTGETTPERLFRARDIGIPVLSKPVEAQTLLNALSELKAPS
jgi:signal transduction histidine kinase